MKIISCQCCGILLDTDRISKPQMRDGENFEIITSNAAWDWKTDDYRPTIDCPLCKVRIFYHNGNTV